MDQILPTGQTITLVHLTYEATVPGGTDDLPVKSWRIACMPNMVELHHTTFHPNYQRSNDPRVVSCPACRKSEVFRKSRLP